MIPFRSVQSCWIWWSS